MYLYFPDTGVIKADNLLYDMQTKTKEKFKDVNLKLEKIDSHIRRSWNR
jgi:hypothetical protein